MSANGMNYPDLLSILQIEDAKVLNLILVGSRLHGTAADGADYDFIMVVLDDTILPEGKKVERPDLDVTIFTKSEFEDSLKTGENWQTIETLWVPFLYRWKFTEDFLPVYNSDPSRLRTAVSSIASKGHAYAKILVTKEKNFRLAKKNIAHEIRNLRLGIQLITHGSITDYTESHELFHQIMADPSENWTEINDRWGNIAMQHQKEFISLTPEKVKIPKAPKKKAPKPKRDYTGQIQAESSNPVAELSEDSSSPSEVATD